MLWRLAGDRLYLVAAVAIGESGGAADAFVPI